MVAGDLPALQAALLLPLERLAEVHRHAISHTPIPAILGGLLSKKEAGQLALHPRLTLKQ
jgi:hypothetical protein